MATRFYFPLDLAADVSPTISSTDWEHVNSVRRKLVGVPDSSTLTTTAYNPDGADDITNRDSHHRQYVSEPLAAMTLSGNVKAQLQCLESHTSNNCYLTLKVWVVSQDGTTARTPDALAITRDTTNELATSLTNRNFPSTALSSVTVQAGDRLVVEIGIGGTPTSGTGTNCHNGSIRWGCNASSGDLPENDTTTTTTYRGWIEFTANLIVPRTAAPAADDLNAAF